MSRIDHLIAKLCPNGVEFKALGDMGEFIRGNGVQKSDLVDVGSPAIHYGQIHTYYGTWASKTKSFVSEGLAARLRKAHSGNLIIATTSEDDNAVAKATAWVGDGDVAVSGDAYIYRHMLEPKYVAYFFQSEQFQDQKKRYITGTKVRRVSGESLAKIRMPVPPREIQHEIVKVLDTFTALEAELEAELQARRRQYQYYRDALLTFDERIDNASKQANNCTVRQTTLGEICQITRGSVMSKDYLRDNAGPYPVYSSQTANNGVFGFINTFDYDGESISWTTDGVNAGSVFYHIDEKFSITNVCGLIKVLDKAQVSTKFLYYWLGQVTKKYVTAGMGNPKLMANVMSKVHVELPSIEDQARIVAILDKFDALVNDLFSGLPAEIAARRQQYEHYRDRLLTFREAV